MQTASTTEQEIAAIPASAPDAFVLTRENLSDGSFIAMIREMMPKLAPGIEITSDEQMAKDQREFLGPDASKEDLWVFAYGSLMWNPAINYRERRSGVVKGWSRRLELWMYGGRGTPDCPGLTLGLQKGGETEGVVMLLPAENAEYELSLVWQREMLTSVYLPQWVQVETDKGPIKAMTVVSNPAHASYAGHLPDERIASIVASATGILGSNADYLSQTIASIHGLGLHDSELEHIQELVMRIREKQ